MKEKIYLVQPWEDKTYHLYIQTNANEEEFKDVIQKIKEIPNYMERDIFTVLEQEGYTCENITPNVDAVFEY